VRRLVALVSAVVLVETVFFSALAPLLPHYSTEFGLSKTEAGMLTALYAAGGLAGALPAGLLAARVGVRPTVLLGLAVMAMTSAVFGLADEVWLLYAARFGQGVGSAIAWTGALAWLVSAAPRERRGEFIGVALGAAIFGALVGPAVGGAAVLFGTAAAFSGVALVAVLLGAWTLTMPSPPPGIRQPVSALAGALRHRQVAVGFWLVSLAAILLGVISVLAPLRLDELGWGSLGISAAFFISAGIEAVLSPVLGRWSDRSGRLAPVRVGLFASIATSVAIPWVDGRWSLIALVVAAAVAYGVFWVPGTALLSDGIDTAGVEQGLGVALLNFAWGPGNVVGAAASGALAGAVGDAGVYLGAAVLCLLTFAAVGPRPLDRRPAEAEGSA
jgi:MFS family permease